MIVTIFRPRLRPEREREYREWADRMEALARAMPGFVSIKTFYARDGERVSIVEFESKEAHEAWRRTPGAHGGAASRARKILLRIQNPGARRSEGV